MLEAGSQLYCRGPDANGEHQYGEIWQHTIQHKTLTCPLRLARVGPISGGILFCGRRRSCLCRRGKALGDGRRWPRRRYLSRGRVDRSLARHQHRGRHWANVRGGMLAYRSTNDAAKTVSSYKMFVRMDRDVLEWEAFSVAG